MQEFGRLPRRGETIKIGELEFRVLRADRRRIDLLRVITPTDIEPPAVDESDSLSVAERGSRCRVADADLGATDGCVRAPARALNLAFAPFGWWPVAVLAPAALFALIRGLPPRRAGWTGAAFGVGLFGFGTYWLYTCLHVFGLVPVWLTLILQAALIAMMSPVLRGAVLPGKPVLAQARRDARLAGAAGAVGAARMAARLVF